MPGLIDPESFEACLRSTYGYVAAPIGMLILSALMFFLMAAAIQFRAGLAAVFTTGVAALTTGIPGIILFAEVMLRFYRCHV